MKLYDGKTFYGNQFTEINLDKDQTTLIIGNNGAGKSTILDALCFSLFGKSFRKINKPQLVNSTNEKDCVVEIEFKIGNTDWKVRRESNLRYLRSIEMIQLEEVRTLLMTNRSGLSRLF